MTRTRRSAWPVFLVLSYALGSCTGAAPKNDRDAWIGSDGGHEGSSEASLPDASAQTSEAGGPDAGFWLHPEDLRPYPEPTAPEGNPITEAKARLGKILFWDEQLSSDDTVACGTCHRPAAGGSDPRSLVARHPGADGKLGTSDDPHGSFGIARCKIDAQAIVRISDPVFGFGPQVTRRRAPSYLDAMFFQSLFLDGRAKDTFVDPLSSQVLLSSGAALESQALMPLLDDSEMACEGRSFLDLTEKLERVKPLALASEIPSELEQTIEAAGARYPPLFEQAFGSSEITAARIAFAIATHERTLRSNDTPFDRFVAGEVEALDEEQRLGMQVFMSKAGCVNCHRPPLFHDGAFHDLGFVVRTWDEGAAAISGYEQHHGMFRTPSLRNVGLREPLGLLHDGVGPDASSLEALIDAYAQNRKLSPNTSFWLVSFSLTKAERAALAAFVRHGLTDPRARDETPPFDRPKLKSEL